MLFFLTAILGYDIWFYLSHLLLHHPFLYPIHAIHHQNVEPQFMDTYHGHWFEMFFQSIGFFTPLVAFEMDWISFGLALVFVNIKGMLRHDSRSAWLIGNHHLLHHKYSHYNFGEVWLDQLGGTLLKENPFNAETIVE